MNYLMIGTYVPTKCGIATFSKDLRDGLVSRGEDVRIAAITDSSYIYPSEVAYRVRHDRPSDYTGCANWTNKSPDINLVLIQHEYGIYGGADGEFILDFAAGLRKPSLLIAHTVLPRPSAHQREVFTRLAGYAAGVVCMTYRARDILLGPVYDLSPAKVFVIPHGVPEFKAKDRDVLKEQMGFKERRLITTFGLIGPGKGLEIGIKALKRVADKYPECVYIIAGGTHPNLLRLEGERYRDKVMQLVAELGLQDRVFFINRFLDLDELGDYLYMTDIYLSPYPNRDQAVSGTLSFAVGCGRAVVATPYEHAVEILDQGRGLVARDTSPEALADLLDAVLGNPKLQADLEAKASRYGRSLSWSSVAGVYSQVAGETARFFKYNSDQGERNRYGL
ncbi:MAG: glycosyltransferase family 4 protein [Syntrophomonadales bacterium]|jgi:glycosyltransferase involved in cell wall biosynthesis